MGTFLDAQLCNFELMRILCDVFQSKNYSRFDDTAEIPENEAVRNQQTNPYGIAAWQDDAFAVTWKQT